MTKWVFCGIIFINGVFLWCMYGDILKLLIHAS